MTVAQITVPWFPEPTQGTHIVRLARDIRHFPETADVAGSRAQWIGVKVLLGVVVSAKPLLHVRELMVTSSIATITAVMNST